jgi:BirA family biotin operon repressor/biotin-[acetyl-CoA-carboxylase] ligase
VKYNFVFRVGSEIARPPPDEEELKVHKPIRHENYSKSCVKIKVETSQNDDYRHSNPKKAAYITHEVERHAHSCVDSISQWRYHMLGIPRIALKETDSTNAVAKARIRDAAAEGTVVTAEHQTAGRGRLDRSWVDAPGQSLLASYILYPRRDAEDWGGVPLLAGLAVHRSISELLPLIAQLKWPNDILIEGRKTAGILIESGVSGSRSWIVVGIGININQREFSGAYRTPPTSLLLESGRQVDPDDLLASLSAHLTSLYDQWTTNGNAAVIKAWKSASHMLEQHITLVQGERQRLVRAVDLADSGALIIENEEGERETVLAGDVSLTIEEQAG